MSTLSDTVEAICSQYMEAKGIDPALHKTIQELRQGLTPLENHLLNLFALTDAKEKGRAVGIGELPDGEYAPVEYVVEAGWALCPIPRGEKGPTARGWNKFGNTIHTMDDAFKLQGLNFGLCHAYSGTCAIDVDDYQRAKGYLADNGIDLDALLNAPDAVKITSGRPGRGKLLYRAPLLRSPSGDLSPLPTLKVADGALELRCGTRKGTSTQDVLPPSIHPDTGRPYQWQLGPRARWDLPPRIPEELLELWLSLARPTVERSELKAPTGATADEIRAILAAHDPDCSYDDWIKVGMALHHETQGSDDGLALWDEWSSRGSKYVGTADLESHWRSFGNHPDPVTLVSLRLPRVATVDAFDAGEADEQLVHNKPKPERFRFLSLIEAFTLPMPSYIVHEVLPEGDIGVIYGQPESGKTFVAIDLCYAVALGKPWRGKEVKQGGVLYVAAEDDAGVRLRLRAYAEAHGIDPSTVPIKTLCDAPNLLDRDTQRDLREAVRGMASKVGARLIVIDTMASVVPGADENSAKDMTLLIDFCKRLHKDTGALVLLVHHEGKTAGKGPRGSSALHGAFVVELLVEDDETAVRRIVVEKLKNGPKGTVYGFKLVPVTLDALDEKPVTSCVVDHVDEAPGRKSKKPTGPSGKNQKLVWRAVLDALPLEGGSIPLEEAITVGARALTLDPKAKRDRRRETAVDAIDGLKAGGWLVVENDEVRHP